MATIENTEDVKMGDLIRHFGSIVIISRDRRVKYFST